MVEGLNLNETTILMTIVHDNLKVKVSNFPESTPKILRQQKKPSQIKSLLFLFIVPFKIESISNNYP